MKKILFRADSSSTIGTGHIMRDLVLATQYPDSEIIFATQALEGNLNTKIVESGYQVKNVLSNDIEELVQVVNELEIDMIIIDHYGIDYEFEKALKEQTHVKIMVLDDTYEKHYCDTLLNHNVSAKKNKYQSLVPSSCEIRTGLKYTLLREEFIKEKNVKKYFNKNKDKKIFLSMGGSDFFNYNLKVLKILKKFRKSQKFKNISVLVTTTSSNRHLNLLKRYAYQHKWVTLYVDSNSIATIMNKSNFAIVTPSVTVNEVIFLKLPFVAFKVIDNQADIYAFLKHKRYYSTDKVFLLKKYIRSLLNG